MKKITSLFTILILAIGLLTGCADASAPVSAEPIPEYVSDISGIEKYRTPVDYYDDDNWHIRQTDGDKATDVIYLYPTMYAIGKASKEGVDDLSDIDDKEMRKKAAEVADRHTAVFTDSCNVYVPFYRQLTVSCIIDLLDNNPQAVAYCASQDLTDALDYYFENCNEGKPFILAGHSQGSIMLTMLLADYMKQHPEYLENMIAAYVIGYSVTKDYLEANPHLKFAEGADDTGVIVSYNTEGPENADERNCVVREGSVCINPVNWKTDSTYASASENLGSLNSDGQIEFGLADAQIDPDRGVVVCTTADPKLYTSKGKVFGPQSYHKSEYALYYMNLKKNIATRIAAFENRN